MRTAADALEKLADWVRPEQENCRCEIVPGVLNGKADQPVFDLGPDERTEFEKTFDTASMQAARRMAERIEELTLGVDPAVLGGDKTVARVVEVQLTEHWDRVPVVHEEVEVLLLDKVTDQVYCPQAPGGCCSRQEYEEKYKDLPMSDKPETWRDRGPML